MRRFVILCVMLAGCDGNPVVPVRDQGLGTIGLLPTAELLLRPASDAQARGAALADQAAALKVKAANIPTD